MLCSVIKITIVQAEILGYLLHGKSIVDMQEELGLSIEKYVVGLSRELCTHIYED